MRAAFAIALLAGLATLLATAGGGRSPCLTARTGWTGYAPLPPAQASRSGPLCRVVPGAP